MRRRLWVGGGLLLVVALIFAFRCLATPNGTNGSTSAPTTTAKTKVHDTAADHASIAGSVTDGAAPIIGARVCAVRSSTLSCTTSDARGRYQISELQAAEYNVRAIAPRHIPPQQQVVALHAEQRTGVDLVMPLGGAEVTGTISDLGGGPIANASVTSECEHGTTAPVESDQHGVFHLWTWPGAAFILASADGYVDGSDDATAPGVANIALIPEATIAGTVIDARTKQPVEGASVELKGDDYFTGDVLSDAHGRFELHKVSFGRYTPEARSPRGFGISDGSVAVTIGQHLDGVVIELHPGGTIVGKAVIVGPPEKPCASAFAYVIGEGGFVRPDVTADGTFRIEGLQPGSYTPSVSCPGYAKIADIAPIVIDKDDVVATWKFGEGSIIRGHVRSAPAIRRSGGSGSTRATVAITWMTYRPANMTSR
jgi:hypothetical protein